MTTPTKTRKRKASTPALSLIQVEAGTAAQPRRVGLRRSDTEEFVAYAECPEVAAVMEKGWLAAHRGEPRQAPAGVNRVQWLRGYQRFHDNAQILAGD